LVGQGSRGQHLKKITIRSLESKIKIIKHFNFERDLKFLKIGVICYYRV
jgi:hypothetical protein